MPLKKQIVPATFTAGLDTGTDPKLVDQALLRASNAVWRKKGSLEKRFGLDSITGASSTANSLFEWNEKPAALGKYLQLYESGTTWNTVTGLTYLIDCESQSILDDGGTILQCEHADDDFGNRIFAYTYSRNGATYCRVAVFDTTSGQRTSTLTLVDGYCCRLVVARGGLCYFFYRTDNGLFLYYGTVSAAGVPSYTATLTMDNVGLTVALSPDDFLLYACPATEFETRDDDYVMLAYPVRSGAGPYSRFTDGTQVMIVDLQTNAVATDTELTGGYPLGLAQTDFDGTVGAGIPCLLRCNPFSAAGASAIVTGCATLPGTAPLSVLVNGTATLTSVTQTGASPNPNQYFHTASVVGLDYSAIQAECRFAYSLFNDNTTSGAVSRDWLYIGYYRYRIPVPGASAAVAGCGMVPLAGPVRVGSGDVYFPVRYAPEAIDGDQRTGYLISYDTKQPVAKFHAGFSVPMLADGIAATAYGNTVCVPRRRVSVASASSNGMALVEFSFSQSSDVVSDSETAIFPNALPREFDGLQHFEQGFIHRPGRLSLTPVAGVGLDSGATYSYKAIYQWTDANGRVHRTDPSIVSTALTTAANKAVNVYVSNIHWGYRSGVKIRVYRTEGNGSVYYFVREFDNGTTAASQYFQDTSADSAITSNEALYTTGGVLENTPPPPYRVSCFHHGRQYIVPVDANDRLIQYSKQAAEWESISHSDALTVTVNSQGGAINALASFMDRLLIFKEHSIYVTSGVEATNTGTGSGPRDPVLVSEVYGTSVPRSVCLTDAGVMFFDSAGGICLLDKTLAVKRVGDAVRYYTDEYPVETATVVPDQGHVVLTTNGGPALVYNYMLSLWSQWTDLEGTVDAKTIGGLLCALNSSATIKRENRAVYTDGGNHVTMDIFTGWFSLAGLSGYKRLYEAMLLGQRIGDSRLMVRIGYDYDPVWIDEMDLEDTTSATTFPASNHYETTPSVASGHGAYIARVRGSRQKVSSIRYRIWDEAQAPAVTGGQGITLSGLTFVVGVKSGMVQKTVREVT